MLAERGRLRNRVLNHPVGRENLIMKNFASAKSEDIKPVMPSNSHAMHAGISSRDPHVQETVARSQKRFHYAFLTSPDSVAIIKAKDRTYTDVNEMFSLFLGHAKEDIIGKAFHEVAAWQNPKEQKQLLGYVSFEDI